MNKKYVFCIILSLALVLVLIPFVLAENNTSLIFGNIYNYDLETVQEDVIVSINTTPKPTIVVADSKYSVNVAPGYYSVTAKYFKDGFLQAQTIEYIQVDYNKEYNLDLILFPDISDEISLLETTGYATFTSRSRYYKYTGYAAGFIILASIVAVIFFYGKAPKFSRTEKKSEDDVEIEQAIYSVQLQPEISDVEVISKEEHKEDIVEESQKISNVTQIPPNAISLDSDLQQVIAIIHSQDGRTTQKDIRKQLPWSEGKVSLMISELESKGLIEKIKKGRGNIIVLKK